MADSDITGLTELTDLANDDVFAVDDTSDSAITKKITGANTLKRISAASVYASPPSSPFEGQMWYPPDSPYSSMGGFRYTGSVWAPANGMTLPVDGDFAWVNQGGAAITATGGALYLKAPTAAGENLRIRVKTAPATPYTITAAFLLNHMNQNYSGGGLLFRQSSDGKIHTFSFHATPGLSSLKWSSATASVAYYVGPLFTTRHLWWLQISDDGTNRIVRQSADGLNWIMFGTIGRTDYLTADQVGYLALAQSTTFDTGMTLLSWKET